MFQPGIYLGSNSRGEMDEQGEKKTPCMVVTFMVAHVAGDNGEWVAIPTPEPRDVYLYLSDKAWPYSCKKLTSLGFNGNFTQPEFTAPTDDGWIQLVCKHEEYRGTMRERWDLAGNGPERTAPAADELRRLAAKFKNDQGGYHESPKPAPAPSRQPVPETVPPNQDDDPPPPPNEDEIPFD